MIRKKIARPDLALPVELWGTIKGATDKLTWLERIDAAITAGMVQRSFLRVAVRIATHWLNKETGLTWRSAENLASDIGMAKSSVEGLLEDAVTAGLLIMVKRGQRGRGKRSAIYRPTMPDVLIPDGPGFEPEVIPDGPGFKPSRKSSRKSRLRQPANPDFGPIIIPAHRDDLPEEVIPEDIIPVAAYGGTTTARADSSNTTHAVRESAPTSATDGPVARTAHAALNDHLAAQHQPSPERVPKIGAGPNGAHADGFDAVRWSQFEDVRRNWPRIRVDEGKAHEVFLRVMAAGHSLQDVIDAVGETLMAEGDVPWLSEALRAIENPRPPTGRGR